MILMKNKYFGMNSKIIKLNKNIYKKEAIVDSISAFSELADIKHSLEGNYYKISFSADKSKNEIEVINDEFCNYILGIQINN